MISRLLLIVLLLGGCGAIPRDPGGTLDRIRQEKSFKVGVVASKGPLDAQRQQIFLARVAADAGARPQLEAGAAEPLLMKLEGGELDLVIGEFAPRSPWSKRVTFLPPLTEQAEDGHTMLVAAAPHGENAWIGLLHLAAVDVAAAQ